MSDLPPPRPPNRVGEFLFAAAANAVGTVVGGLILVAYAKAAGFFQGVALGGGLGVGIGARLGNVVFWIVIGAVAGLAIAAPEDDAPTRDHP